MAYLGVSYQLAYEAKNFRSGLTDIIAMVVKPNGAVVGPVSLTEFVAMGFQGLYGYSFVTQLNDPEGEYLASIISPTENIRDFHRFTLDQRPAASGVTIQSAGSVIGYVNATAIIQGNVIQNNEVMGVVQADASVCATLSENETIETTLNENQIIGALE